MEAMMMPAADDDDDFIVQTVVETGTASDARENGAFGWGLKKLGGFVFANADGASERSAVVEPEPTLPPGFSSTLNAEEELIYPAEAKIKVLVAEGSLAGRARRHAAELHQALQQVVGAAAIYNHLLSKHGGVGTRRRRSTSDATPNIGRSNPCACGAAVGSCKAISSLLKGELDKVFDLAEKERKGALLKKFKRVERRSGGLCNPDLLQEAIRNASTDPEYAPMSPSASTGDILSLKHPPRRPSGNLAEMSGLALVGLGDAGTAGFTAVTGTGGGAVNTEDIPWADDLLCMATRKRHAAMLKARGRALAKGLARLLRGVSSDLKEVASRLPPWEETEPEEEEECLAPEATLHSRSQSRSSIVSADTDCSASDRPLSSRFGDLSAVHSAMADAVKVTPPLPATKVPPVRDGTAEDVKSRRLDWKLNAEELSLIRREEERVMKPAVLRKLLAAGAALECLQQADFWDVFARLEVATRTEALLNIAIRGGRGCAARSARMGRELCMSLTSVVLEAISTVEQDPLRFSSNNSQPAPQAPSPRQPQREQLEAEQPLSQSDSSEQSPLLDEVHETLEEGQEKGRTSSKRLSTRSILALAQAAQATQAARAAQAKQAAGGRARSGSECNILMPQRRAVRRTPMAGPRKFFKEDAGLRDLDAREEEFRKAIYVNRSALASRLLQLTSDAPLCAKVLGTFVMDEGTSHGAGTQIASARGMRPSPFASSPASLPPAVENEAEVIWKSASHEYGEVLKPNAETCGEVNLLGFSESCGSPGAWQLSMTSSTDKLSEEGTDEAAGSEHSSVPPVEQDAGGNPADRHVADDAFANGPESV